jgi:hypothetical protein
MLPYNKMKNNWSGIKESKQIKEWTSLDETYEEIYSVLSGNKVDLKIEFRIAGRVSSIDINNVLIKKSSELFIEVIGPNKMNMLFFIDPSSKSSVFYDKELVEKVFIQNKEYEITLLIKK